ncbi:MAG: hypothetical protein FWE34_04535 [Defluviitaleaceae bacterium]|nr:hypothetical protein [Defluviitaleaceae bacterium]
MLTNTTREGFLEDFDYFIDHLRTYFPYLGVVYRRLGVNLIQIAEDLRPILEGESLELDEDVFLQILLDNFFANPALDGHTFAHWHLDGQNTQVFFTGGVQNNVEIRTIEEDLIACPTPALVLVMTSPTT